MTTAATDLFCDWGRPLSPLDCRSLSIEQPEYFPGLQYARAVNEVIYIAAGGGQVPQHIILIKSGKVTSGTTVSNQHRLAVMAPSKGFLLELSKYF